MSYKTIIGKQPLILNTYTSNVNMKIAEFILYPKSEKTVLFWPVPPPANITPSPSFEEGTSHNGKNIETAS